MIAKTVFNSALVSFKTDRSSILRLSKLKKRKTCTIHFLRSYRKDHVLEGISKTLLLWRHLDELFIVWIHPKIHKELERRIMRSFYFLLKSTTPQDIEILQHLSKQVVSGGCLHRVIELRLIELVMGAPQAALPRLTSPHYKVQSQEALQIQWKNIAESTIEKYGIKTPQFGVAHARPLER